MMTTMPELRIIHHTPPVSPFHRRDNGSYDVNLLSKSLTSKLRQQRKSRSPTKTGRKEDSVAIRVAKSILAHREKSGHSRLTDRSEQEANVSDERVASGVKCRRKDSLSAPAGLKGSADVRVDSASSDRLPLLPGDYRKRGKQSGRRSNSASPGGSTVGSRASLRHANGTPSSHNDLRFLHSSSTYELPGTRQAFEVYGPGRSVMVVKRDGVFQPLDKYAPCRQVMRENTFDGKRDVCHYETYQISNGQPSEAGGSAKSQEESRKNLKVSWSPSKTNTDYENESHVGDVKDDGRETPFTPAPTIRKALSIDNFAFRRPVYSSGRSKVRSIGVKWEVPNVTNEENRPSTKQSSKEPQSPPPQSKEESSKKPMWSWLITNEGQKTPSQQKSQGGGLTNVSLSPGHHVAPGSHKQSSRASVPGTTCTGSQASSRIRRDVHPMTTAMDREGTSVTRTKWHVPGNTSSTLEAERAIFSRLELVKRPGSQLLYDYPLAAQMVTASEHLVLPQRSQQASRERRAKSKTLTKRTNMSEQGGQEVDECEEMKKRKSFERNENEEIEDSDVESSHSSCNESDEDGTLSPTKSRNT